MRPVAVLGIGQTAVGEHWERSLRDLATQAGLAAMRDAGLEHVQAVFVGNMLSGLLTRQENLGALVADWLGQLPAEAFKIEAACASGAAAFRVAHMAVSSGEVDVALAVGVEKMTDTTSGETTAALATASDADYELVHGVTFVGLNALVMRRYLHEFGWTHTDFAPFSINAHANGARNPNARLQEPISERDYTRARMVCDPINLLDASPIGDGAAAAVLVPAERVYDRPRARVLVTGSASATDTLAVHDRKDPLFLSAAYHSARKAYAQAGLEPAQIDFFELHDAFSIMSALSLEACGFAERGQGPRLGLEGRIRLQQALPISTQGGLKARGHPVGATGMYQLVEVVQQLRGEAGPNQLERARVGMAQNIGGSGAMIATHILRVA
ncbi:MAG TPA: thiolase domain-containing protein [Anaerolineales bacterium]|nr:thiolase domain-containing protein [Anaerolineales bacterium]